MRIMPSCRELAEWSGEACCTPPSFWRRLLLRLHMRLCPPCAEYHDQIREVGDLAREDVATPCSSEVARIERCICRELGLPAPPEAPSDDAS